jgi:hypothetical protein
LIDRRLADDAFTNKSVADSSLRRKARKKENVRSKAFMGYYFEVLQSDVPAVGLAVVIREMKRNCHWKKH